MLDDRYDQPIQIQPPGAKKAKKRPRRDGDPANRFRIIKRFWNHPETPNLSLAAQAVWSYLWMLADAKGRCYPSQNRIGRRVGCSREYARKLIKALKEAGFVEVIRPGNNVGRNRANVYRIRLPKGESDVQL